MRLLAAPTAKCASERNDSGSNDGGDSADEEERDDGNDGADGGGERAGGGGDQGIRQGLFGCAEAFAGERAQHLLRIAGDVVDHVVGVCFGQAFDLVVEREQFAGFRSVHPDGFALAGDFSVVDFALALGGEVGAGAHGEGGGDHAGEAGEENILAVAGGSAGDAGDDAEDGAEAVVDAVDGVADPCAGLLAALAALGQQLVEDRFGVDFGRARRRPGSGRGEASRVRGGDPFRLR